MKKGITLIELLAVIIILAIIGSISFITIGNIVKNSKINLYNENITKIKDTAEMYISNGNKGYIEEGQTVEITLDELIEDGYLKEVKSPFDKSKTCNGYVLVSKLVGGDYSYNPHINCVENINNSTEDSLLASYDFDNKSQYRKNLILNSTVNALPRLSSTAQTISYGTAVASTEQSLVGTKSLKIYNDYSSTVGSISFASNDMSGMIAGQTYTFSFYVYIPSSVDLSSIRIIFYDYVSSASSTSLYYYNADIPRDTWYRLSITRTLRDAATRAYANIYWYHNEPLTSIGQTIYLDAFQLEQGSVATNYAADANNLVLYSACNSTPRLSSTALTASWCSAACSTDRAFTGTKSLKMTRTLVAYSRYNLASNNLSGMIPGKDNTISFYVFVPEDNNAITQFRIRWYDYGPSGNVYFDTNYYVDDIPKGQWHRISATRKLNADSTRSFIYLFYYVNNTVLSHNQPVYLDGFQLEVESEPTGFFETYENGLIEDSSTTNNNISLGINTSYWVDTDNEREGFYDFNSSTKMVTNNNIAISGSQPRTIIGWINTRDGTAGTSNFSVMAGHGTSDTGNDFCLGVQLNKIAVGYWGTYTVGNTTIENNKWYHIAATYDGTKTKIYINGVLDKEEVKSINTPVGPLRIGDRSNDAHTFSGYIDDVKVFGRTLSEEEIKLSYELTK